MGTLNEKLTWELNFGQNHMGINLRCYWELFGEQLENLRSSLGISWEPMGTTEKIK
jgi:hypothetical protein